MADDIITEVAEPPAALTLVEASAPVASASVASEVAVAEPGLRGASAGCKLLRPSRLPAPKPVVRNSAAANRWLQSLPRAGGGCGAPPPPPATA